MVCFRIVHKKYDDPLFAPGIEGRWNRAGQKVLYCSDSVALAFLESMVRRRGLGFNHDFQIAHIEIPDSIPTQTILEKNLEKGWNNPVDYLNAQRQTNQWYDRLESLVLIVPSAVLSAGNNYVLNTMHTDFIQIKLIGLAPLVPDQRIEEILKGIRI